MKFIESSDYMKKRVKILMEINLLCYFSFFIYSYVYSKIEIKNWWVIIAFIPYVLVVLSSFIVFNNKKDKFNSIRVEGIIDLLLRVITLFTNFYTTTLEKFSLKFKLIILFLVLLFILNIFLEVLMYRKATLYKEDKYNMNWYDISFEDRINYNDMFKSVKKSFGEMSCLVIIITIILGVNKNSSTSSMIGLSVISLALFIFFLKRSYATLELFYKDKDILKKNFIKENSYVVISLILGVIFCFGRFHGYGDKILWIYTTNNNFIS